MIARVWRGWTKAENADTYEKLLQEVVYPGLQTIDGYLGGTFFATTIRMKPSLSQ